MKRELPLRAERLLDRETRELVSEADRGPFGPQHPCGEALVEMVDLVGRQPFQQPPFADVRYHRDRLEQRARRRL